MKSALLAVAFLLCISAQAQSDENGPCKESTGSAKAVRNWVEADQKLGSREGTLLGVSWIEKSVKRMGDEMAVNLLHAYSDEEMLQGPRLKSILAYLEAAFSSRDMITCKEHRRPRITLLLLRSLYSRTSEDTLRKRISQLENELSRH